MKKNVKRVLLGIILLAAAISGLYSLTAPKQIALTRVTPGTAELTFTEEGEVTGSQSIKIYPLTEGKVLTVPVREGQQVQAGDIICTIDPEPILEKISQVKSTIKSYESQRESKNSTIAEQQKLQLLLIEQNEKELSQAKRELERIAVLYQGGFLSQAEYEVAQQNVTQHQSALNVSQQELKVLSAEVTDSETRSYYQSLIDIEHSNLKLLEKQLEHSTVIAAADGIITALPVKNTNYVGTEPIAELTITDQTYIETHVSTADISSIAIGAPVRLTLNQRESDIEITGTITHMSDTASLKISPLGLEERKVKVEITPELSTLDIELGVGYDIDVEFLIYQEENQLTVPKSALFKANGTDMVWLVQHGTLKATPVTTGIELRTETVILSGIEPETYVVTEANNEILKPGLRIASPQ